MGAAQGSAKMLSAVQGEATASDVLVALGLKQEELEQDEVDTEADEGSDGEADEEADEEVDEEAEEEVDEDLDEAGSVIGDEEALSGDEEAGDEDETDDDGEEEEEEDEADDEADEEEVEIDDLDEEADEEEAEGVKDAAEPAGQASSLPATSRSLEPQRNLAVSMRSVTLVSTRTFVAAPQAVSFSTLSVVSSSSSSVPCKKVASLEALVEDLSSFVTPPASPALSSVSLPQRSADMETLQECSLKHLQKLPKFKPPVWSDMLPVPESPEHSPRDCSASSNTLINALFGGSVKPLVSSSCHNTMAMTNATQDNMLDCSTATVSGCSMLDSSSEGNIDGLSDTQLVFSDVPLLGAAGEFSDDTDLDSTRLVFPELCIVRAA